MCLITILPSLSSLQKEGKPDIDTELFRNAWYFNEDGAGISFVDYNHLEETKEPIVKIYKNYNLYTKFEKSFKKLRVLNPESKFMVHLRNASMGSSFEEQNCHPFWVFKNELSMCHNGTLYKVGSRKDTGASDSNVLAKMMSTLPKDFLHRSGYKNLINNYIGESNRLAFIDNQNKTHMFGKGWINEDGIFFSNDYYKKEIPRVITKFNKDKCEKCQSEFNKDVHPVVYNGKTYCFECFQKVEAEVKEQLKTLALNAKVTDEMCCSVCNLELIYPVEFESGMCFDCSRQSELRSNFEHNIYDEYV